MKIDFFKNAKLINYIELVVIIFSILPILISFNMAYWPLRSFVQSGFDYQKQELSDPIVNSSVEAKKIIPLDSLINFSPKDWVIDRVKATYYMLPEYNISENEAYSYFIDFDGTHRNFFTKWQSRRLPTGVIVYAKPGYPFSTTPTRIPQQIPLAVRLLIFLGAAIITATTGAILILNFFDFHEINDLLWFISSSYLTGFITFTLPVWFLMASGVMLTKTLIIFLWVGILIVLIFFSYHNLSKIRKATAVVIVNTKNLGNSRKLDKLDKVLFIIGCVIIFFLLLSCAFRPIYQEWDTMSHWIIKSKMFFVKESLDFNLMHNDVYPILWSLNIAEQFTLIGGAYAEIVKWSVTLMFIAFLFQIRGFFKAVKTRDKIFLVCLICFFISFLDQSITSGYAEIGYLAFLTASLTCLVAWVRNERYEYLYMTLLFSIGLSAIKLEGIATSVFIGTSILIYGLIQKKKIWFGLTFIAIPTALILWWHSWLSQVGYSATSDQFTSTFSLTKIQVIFTSVLRDATTVPYAIFFILFILALILNLKLNNYENLKKPELILSLISLMLIGFIFVSLTGWDIAMISSASETATSRLFMHAGLSLTLLMGILLDKI
jgi:hypothetical protein